MAELKRQQVATGGVAVLKDADRFVYYLVTKDRSTQKPTYDNLALSLAAMRDHMVNSSYLHNRILFIYVFFQMAHNVKKVAMPRIGCGIDGMVWEKVVDELTAVFGEGQVELIIYNFVPK